MKTFFSESPDLTSPGFSSEDFYVGIKASFIQFKKWFVLMLLAHKRDEENLKFESPIRLKQSAY